MPHCRRAHGGASSILTSKNGRRPTRRIVAHGGDRL
jgi:hypothetical protein